MRALMFILMLTLVSCDDDWGQKILDFSKKSAPDIVSKLSKKDLDFKWFNYYLTTTSYSLAEINRANLTLNNLEELDLANIENDKMKLMITAYKLDQQIQTLYIINSAIFNASQAYDELLGACTNRYMQNLYAEKRVYLLNALQMSMPQMNFSYGARINISHGESKTNNESGSGFESVPLVGNVITYFSEKKFKENKEKFQEAQEFINNLRLDSGELLQSSNNSCVKYLTEYKDTIDIIRTNIEIEKSSFTKMYSALVNLRNAVSPLVIKNIIAGFDSGDLMIYDVEKETKFTKRLMEVNSTLKILSPNTSDLTAETIEVIEDNLEITQNLINEMEIMQNSVLGLKNAPLISMLLETIKIKRNSLLQSVQGKLK